MRRVLALVLLVAAPCAAPSAQPASARALLDAAAAAGAVADPAARTAAVTALWSSLRPGQATSRVPFVAADTAVFLYRGTAASVAVAGDATGWQPTAALVRQGQSDLWLRTDRFDASARLDYKLVTGGSTWLLDPANPNRQMSGFGPNSELRMPAWQAEPLTVRDAAVPRGTLGAPVTVSSTHYTTAPVTYRVWTPAGYAGGTDRLPAVYVTDGHEYADDALGAVQTVLDNAVAQNLVEPCVVVFIDPRQGGQNRRQEQYVANAGFAAFVATELVPAVDAAYRTRAERGSRVILGTSLGGLFSVYLGTQQPGTFGLLAVHSPAFWASPAISAAVSAAPAGAFRVAMTSGTVNDAADATRAMRDRLRGRGHTVAYREVAEGHSWGNWRALVDDVLAPLIPARSTSGEPAPSVPDRVRLDAVPNPARAAALRLRYTLAEAATVRVACYDAAGRQVAALPDVDAAAGTHDAALGGFALAAGVYACRLTAGADSATRTLTVLP